MAAVSNHVDPQNCQAASLEIEAKDVSTSLDITGEARGGVHSWLKSKAQHFNGGCDFDVFVTNDEI
jgi:hypothetical protein